MTGQHNQLIAAIVEGIRKINNKIALIKQDKNTIIIDSAAYGTSTPDTGVEGQLFFVVQEHDPDTEPETTGE